MISVIVIIKDTRDYLKKCLDSVCNQSFRYLQVIVVDDHPHESSADIVAEYKSTIDIEYYYLEEDAGPGGARNIGLKYATGELICFLDSDDWIDLDYLSAAEEVMSKYQADIGMCGLVRNYDSPSYQPIYKCKYTKVHTMNGTTAFRILSGQYDFGVIVSPSPVNKVYRRALLERNNIRECKKYLNHYAAVTNFDFLDAEDIHDLAYDYMVKLREEKLRSPKKGSKKLRSKVTV